MNENIEKGKIPTHKFVCDTCGTRFIADFDEYEASVYDRYDAVVYKCKCPLCDTTVKDVVSKMKGCKKK